MAADSNPSNYPISLEKLIELLACPACEGELRLVGSASPEVSESPDRLLCVQCGRAYPIVNGIPELIAARD